MIATKVIERRSVGKASWRMTLNELLESEQSDLARLRRLRDKHLHDAETQRLIGELLYEKAERLLRLNELLRYKGKDDAPWDGVTERRRAPSGSPWRDGAK